MRRTSVFLLLLAIGVAAFAGDAEKEVKKSSTSALSRDDDECRWSRWSPCSVTCGRGLITRARTCRCDDDDKKRGYNSRRRCFGRRIERRSCLQKSCRPQSKFVAVGCYADKHDRALPNFVAKFHNIHPKLKIGACANLARALRVVYFGMQDGGECWVDRKGRNQYSKHDVSSNCKDGIGGKWTNYVYRIKL